MAYIECKNLILGYEKQVVRKDITFKVNKGDYLCIVGENGSGKSTLMKTLLSLQKPIGGEIIFSDGLNKSEIGYLPQQSTVKKDFPATNFEIVLSGCLGKNKFKFFYNEEEKNLAIKSMKRMNVYEFKDKCFRELSGGQQQRVLLARAICATSKVLLLDEPVAGLDPKVTVEMYDLVEELNKKDGITIIMISHDLYDALKYASHILHIRNVGNVGNIKNVEKEIFFGTKEQYLKSEIGKTFISTLEGGKK